MTKALIVDAREKDSFDFGGAEHPVEGRREPDTRVPVWRELSRVGWHRGRRRWLRSPAEHRHTARRFPDRSDSLHPRGWRGHRSGRVGARRRHHAHKRRDPCLAPPRVDGADHLLHRAAVPELGAFLRRHSGLGLPLCRLHGAARCAARGADAAPRSIAVLGWKSECPSGHRCQGA
jgi:hypothetical protein